VLPASGFCAVPALFNSVKICISKPFPIRRSEIQGLQKLADFLGFLLRRENRKVVHFSMNVHFPKLAVMDDIGPWLFET